MVILIISSKLAYARTTLKYRLRTYFHPGGMRPIDAVRSRLQNSDEDVAVYVKTRSVAVMTR